MHTISLLAEHRYRASVVFLASLTVVITSLTQVFTVNAQTPSLKVVEPREIRPGEPFQIEFRGTNIGSQSSRGSITISLPRNSDATIVSWSTIPTNNASYIKTFEPGEVMFNASQGRNAPISGRTIELYAEPWP